MHHITKLYESILQHKKTNTNNQQAKSEHNKHAIQARFLLQHKTTSWLATSRIWAHYCESLEHWQQSLFHYFHRCVMVTCQVSHMFILLHDLRFELGNTCVLQA